MCRSEVNSFIQLSKCFTQSSTREQDVTQNVPLIDPALMTLKSKLDNILTWFDPGARCVYVDYPLHTNVGDLLINAGAEHFFAEHGLQIWRRYNYYDFPRQIKDIRKTDVILLHGGGNFGDLWFHFQSLRERILAQYPDNRVIFLPQTVHFSSDERGQASVRRINRHRNCHVFARDCRSLEKLQGWGINSVSLMPDTAHALTGFLGVEAAVQCPCALHLIRRDREASSVPADLSSMPGDTCDWDYGMFSLRRRMMHFLVVNSVKALGRYGPAVDCHRAWYLHRDRLIHDAIRRFQNYDTIVTNRLHGVLLGLFLGRNVVAFDNNYGKLSSYRETWLQEAQQLTFESSLHRDAVTVV